MNLFNKRKVIYVCDVEGKKGKIFYDIKLSKFRAEKGKKNTTVSSLAFFSTMGYVILRRINHITISVNPLTWAVVLTFVGVCLGFISIILMNKLSKPILTEEFTPSSDEIKSYVLRGSDLLSRQKAGFFFLFIIGIINHVNFFVSKDILSLILIPILWIGCFLFFNFVDFSRRKKIYTFFIESNAK